MHELKMKLLLNTWISISTLTGGHSFPSNVDECISDICWLSACGPVHVDLVSVEPTNETMKFQNQAKCGVVGTASNQY